MKTLAIQPAQRLLLRVGEAAELLGVSRTKLYSMIGTGEISTIRLGGSVRISRAALEEWILQKQAVA